MISNGEKPVSAIIIKKTCKTAVFFDKKTLERKWSKKLDCLAEYFEKFCQHERTASTNGKHQKQTNNPKPQTLNPKHRITTVHHTNTIGAIF